VDNAGVLEMKEAESDSYEKNLNGVNFNADGLGTAAGGGNDEATVAGTEIKKSVFLPHSGKFHDAIDYIGFGGNEGGPMFGGFGKVRQPK